MKFLQQFLTLLFMVGITSFASAQDNISVTAPAGIAGDYTAIQAAFGQFSNGESGTAVLIDDGAGVTVGCDPASNDLTGAIALVDRGACGFAQKMFNAETAGAIAIVVCNSLVDFPDSIIVMGGGNGCTSTIPGVMISYASCETIKAELGNGVTITMPSNIPAVGTNVGNPTILPGEGMYSVDTVIGTGSLLADATAAAMQSITPAMDVAMTVSSCLGGADTRLTIVQGCRNELVVSGQNDDACLYDATIPDEEYASELTIVAYGGQEYLLHWDDRWDANGFDYEITYASLEMASVTFTVDMSTETVDMANPPMIAGSFTAGAQEALTDNGNGTWSGTYMILQGEAVQYKFLNGMDVFESSAELEACGVDDGAGGFDRAYTVGLGADQTLGNVCFASCSVCPPPACSDPDAIICDDFEGYDLDLVSGQSAHFTPWGMTAGAADDATVSADFASSGSQSLLVSAANGDDMLLLLGDQTTGNFLLQWKMYIPDGNTGYFNTQKIEGTAGGEFGMQIQLLADNTYTLDAGGAAITTGAWTPDSWMNVVMTFDLTNDWASLYIDGAEVYSWPASDQALAQGGTLQLGAVNFFGNTNTVQYIDDILFKALPECPDDAVICDSYEGYAAGTTTGGQSPWWSTWSGTFGTAEDGIVSDDQAFDGNNSMFIGDNGAQDVLLLLGNRTSGNWMLEMQMYVPEGNIGYLNIQESETPGVQWNMEAWFNGTNANPSVYTAGMGQLASGETFTCPEGTWFPVVNMIDLDNSTHTLMIDGNVVLDNVPYIGDQLGAIDFFSISDIHAAYFDAVRLVELEPVLPDPVDVTFTVNMEQTTVSAEGVFLAGTFNSFPNPGLAMTDNGDQTWSVTVPLIPGEAVEFKYQNGTDGAEDDFPDSGCGTNNNRFLTVGDSDTALDLVCFNQCADCIVGVEETAFATALSLFPNPTSNATSVTYNFAETVDLDITVSNTIGQQLYTASLGAVQNGVHQIDLTKFAAGIYFVQMTDGTNNLTKRLIVE